MEPIWKNKFKSVKNDLSLFIEMSEIEQRVRS